MSNSSLISYTRISPNRTSPRNHKIDTITIHCVVGQCSVQTLGNTFASPARQASANYGIGYDGKIGLYVEEEDRSWCSSNADNDNRAITIEVASDTYHPYAVTDKAYAALIDLCTDICKRNGIEKLVWSESKADRIGHKNGCNMTVHRDYANKSCPGDWLYSRHGEIAAEVNKRLQPTNVQKAPAGKASCYVLSGTDIGRGTDKLIRYTKGRTGTNQYGWETAVDKNGIVLSDPVYGEGNMEVPAGGYVLSGHGEAGKWLYGHVKQGYLAGVYDGTVKIEQAYCRSLDGVDVGRGENQLIAYTRGRTGTNRYGWEVCIVDGIATSDAIYGNGNIWVGEGTYVLSGHGEAGRWLYGHVKKGTRVDVDTRFGFVRVW
ncbi:peptidoglycan recognition protein family protein [Bacteroides acidifaciens]|uniref:peptidoglycan recognition protein family protein n=1 Tax=Bacteroides acidifaciens TaxID=85831 RepID=UPI00260FB230|nr:peptidoglycan recognition family protein [Bacteroides acidifaciens]